MDAARAVLDRRGLQGLTLDEVARAVGLTKAALYYYFPSKDALLGELHHRSFEQMAQRLHDAVEPTTAGPDALRALIRETVQQYAPRMNDFRLTFLQPQLAAEVLEVTPERLARIRPLNDLAFGGAAKRVQAGREAGTEGVASVDRGAAAGGAGGAAAARRTDVDPRLLAFLAHLAALGVLTMKGLVEAFDDPLRYSDEELIEALGRVFGAAAGG